jgi:HEAT repeat protein
VDLEDAAFAELEAWQNATFEEALEAIQEDSLEPSVLTGFSDISRKQVHELRRVWTEIADENARRVIADHVLSLGMEDLRLDFMRFFRVLLDDPAAAVRQIAASGLEPYDDTTLIEPLVALASSDPDEGVRLAAIEALGSFTLLSEFEMLNQREQISLRRTLMGLAMDETLAHRLRAAALASLALDASTPNIRKAIQELYDTGEPELRLGAIRAMGRAGGEWVGILEAALRSQDPDEREAAATSVSQFEDENVVPMLTMLAREDLEMPVRVAAIEGLAAHGGRAALHSLHTLREYVSDDELETVEAAIEEVQEFLNLEENPLDEGFVFDPSIDDEDDEL